ncbi:MAG: hypothetical protein ABGX27_06230 [Desulfurobacteriaceae bacterium]
MDERLKNYVIFATPFIFVFLYLTVVYFPLKNSIEKLATKKEKIYRDFQEIEPKLREIKAFNKSFLEIEKKLKNGKRIDIVSFIKVKAQKFGVNVKDLKVSVSDEKDNVERKTVALSFYETPFKSVKKLIWKLENSPYYLKAVFFQVSDMDENGLVSGKVVFNFYEETR